MNSQASHIAGEPVLIVGDEGPPLKDATDLIGEALSAGAGLIVIPAVRLDPAFFQLSSGVAGEMLQKFVNYRRRVAIVGDVAAHVAASKALHDFVYESNKGSQVWFVEDLAALERRLSGGG